MTPRSDTDKSGAPPDRPGDRPTGTADPPEASEASTDTVDDRRVLIVDDDEDLAESLADLLIARGYEVEIAKSARQAVDIGQRFDLQVALQRIVGDQLPLSVHRFTIYSSPEDEAIGVASRLFASPRGRLGTFGVKQVEGEVEAAIEYSTSNTAFVNFKRAADVVGSIGDSYGHSYFRDAPSVASDLVLMLRDDLDPGTPGRPLERLGHHFWRVPKGCPGGKPAR